MCNLVKSILEGDANAKKIPIKKVRGDILELIVEYLKHHNGKKPEEIAKNNDGKLDIEEFKKFGTLGARRGLIRGLAILVGTLLGKLG